MSLGAVAVLLFRFDATPARGPRVVAVKSNIGALTDVCVGAARSVSWPRRLVKYGAKSHILARARSADLFAVGGQCVPGVIMAPAEVLMPPNDWHSDLFRLGDLGSTAADKNWIYSKAASVWLCSGARPEAAVTRCGHLAAYAPHIGH